MLYIVFSKFVPVVSLWETQAEPTAEKPSRAGVPTGAMTAAMLLMMMTLAGTARAAEPATPAAASISLKVEMEDGKKMIVATVRRGEAPVVGAKVVFKVPRTFGELTLGAEETLDDGTAAVPFPETLPGDSEGKLRVIATIQSPEALAATRLEATLAGGTPFTAQPQSFPRALWAPRAPVGLLVTLGVLMAVVWGAFAYVGYQLLRIKLQPKL